MTSLKIGLHWTVTVLALLAASTAALILVRQLVAQLTINSYAHSVQPDIAVGHVEALLIPVPLITAAAALARPPTSRLALLCIGLAGLLLGMLKGFPFWFALQSPGFQLVVPAILVATAIVVEFRTHRMTNEPGLGSASTTSSWSQ